MIEYYRRNELQMIYYSERNCAVVNELNETETRLFIILTRDTVLRDN